jgi:hypothetical protein
MRMRRTGHHWWVLWGLPLCIIKIAELLGGGSWKMGTSRCHFFCLPHEMRTWILRNTRGRVVVLAHFSSRVAQVVAHRQVCSVVCLSLLPVVQSRRWCIWLKHHKASLTIGHCSGPLGQLLSLALPGVVGICRRDAKPCPDSLQTPAIELPRRATSPFADMTIMMIGRYLNANESAFFLLGV